MIDGALHPYRKRWFLQHYGADVRVGWNHLLLDNWLPQIYRKSGIDYFVTQKMSWNDTNKLPLKLFWWESPDGSKVLTYFPHGYGEQKIQIPVHLSQNLRASTSSADRCTGFKSSVTISVREIGQHFAAVEEIPTRKSFKGRLFVLFHDIF